MELLTGTMLPLTFFPDAVRRVAEVLPFAGIAYLPVSIWMGTNRGDAMLRALAIQAFWAVALFVIGRVAVGARRSPHDGAGRLILGRDLRLLAAYLGQFVKSRLSYRGDFIVDTVAVLLALSVHLVFLNVVYSKIESLVGWSFDQLLFIYGFSLIPLGLFNLVSDNLWEFSDGYLIEGRFDRVLLRPVSPLFQILFESFNLASVNEILIGAILMATAGSRLGLSPQWSDAVTFPVLAVSAAAIYLGVFLLLTSLSFWWEDRLGIGAPVYNVIRFARYPINIFQPIVRFILVAVVPFAFAAFYPSTVFLRAAEYRPFVWATPAVAAVLMAGAMATFHAGVRRYRSTGS